MRCTTSKLCQACCVSLALLAGCLQEVMLQRHRNGWTQLEGSAPSLRMCGHSRKLTSRASGPMAISQTEIVLLKMPGQNSHSSDSVSTVPCPYAFLYSRMDPAVWLVQLGFPSGPKTLYCTKHTCTLVAHFVHSGDCKHVYQFCLDLAKCADQSNIVKDMTTRTA